MDDLESRLHERATAVVNRTLGIGAAAIGVLLVIALTGGEGVDMAAVAAVGGIVTALVGLAATYLRRNGR